MKPLTGNIYKETFTDRGKRYVNYYIDCAECGNEIGEHGFSPGETVTNRIKRDGWKKHPIHGKWVCPACNLTRANKPTAQPSKQENILGDGAIDADEAQRI